MSTSTKERPIIFSSEMIRAILDNRKRQTRRVVKFRTKSAKLFGQQQEHFELKSAYPAREKGWIFWSSDSPGLAEFTKRAYSDGITSPYGEPGDRLWVKEAWYTSKKYDPLPPAKFPVEAKTIFRYLGSRAKPEWAGRTRSARFMPRWASRITLEIVNVRVERLQDVSDDDAKAEGFEYYGETLFKDYGEILAEHTAIYKYASYWDLLNARQGFLWKSNPWVWMIEFRMLGPAEASNL